MFNVVSRTDYKSVRIIHESNLSLESAEKLCKKLRNRLPERIFSIEKNDLPD
jgi:hypothetical protein